MFKKQYITGAFLAVISLFSSCTNLDEEIFSSIPEKDFYKTESEFLAAMVPIYSSMRTLTEHSNWWDLEETTDVCVTPVKNHGLWYDGGIYIRLHQHSWMEEDAHLNNIWNALYSGVSSANRVLYQFENSWSENVWQQFELDGNKVGAPVFIVNVTQSPNYPGEINEREFRSIWNQAWFSSLRSASGLYRYARRTGNRELLAKANLTKELALSFPQRNGFFYGLIGTEMHEVEIDGKKYNRSKGWNTYYWGNSNRNPYTWNPKESPYHILDMSWTALLMLRWYDELEKDARLLAYAEDYAMALLGIQYENGFFPGWLDLKTMQPMNHLNASPETSLSVTFLLKLYELTHKEEYKRAAFKAMNAVIHEIIPVGKWEDFETYWSCSRYGSDNLVGKKVLRNNMHKQNNFSMFWTAEALLECYRLTSNKEYLDYGQRTLDELLMTQASWQPPYMYVNVLGGFGVLNADGEWNDSRESLFSELIIQYGKLLDKPEYIERGYAALKASFVMMYCTENPQTKQQWEKVHPFFASEDYGFMMENYGHGGRTNPAGEGMGEFTIYDWGNGAAAEAYNRILDKFGKIE